MVKKSTKKTETKKSTKKAEKIVEEEEPEESEPEVDAEEEDEEEEEYTGEYLKVAQTAYFAFTAAKREEFVARETEGDGRAKMIASIKKMAEAWKSMSEAEKKPYEDISAKDRKRYEADIARGLKRKPKKGKKVKKEKDPNKPKRGMSAFFLWQQDNRAKIIKEHGVSGKHVATKAGELWKTISDKERAPYEKRSAKEREAYTKAMETYVKPVKPTAAEAA